jgi:SAM-dependent methyltransferase
VGSGRRLDGPALHALPDGALAAKGTPPRGSAEDRADWPLACPACRTPFGPLSAHEASGALRCPGCGLGAERVDGIWRFLPPAAAARYAPFLADYTRIRLAEQRGSDDPAYYLDLPHCPPDHPIAGQWALRRRTFAAFTRRVLPRLAARAAGAAGMARPGDGSAAPRQTDDSVAAQPGNDSAAAPPACAGLRIVDLGAGVGWLCHRLALLGHHPAAVDLSLDDRDGLDAARHYRPAWPRFQAEFDRLPFAAGAADLVIFNASLHYSADYEVTLAEALRVLAGGGALAILESPIYRRPESGRRMVEERRAEFARRFGTRSDALPSRDYLTWPQIAELERRLGLRCEKITPWYGWRWALRPWLARIRRRREPSRFVILLATRAGS